MKLLKYTHQFFISALLLVCLLSANAQDENSTEVQWAEINLQVSDELVIPAYQALETSARSLRTSTENFCMAPNENALQNLRAAFHDSMDKWQAVQHIQFGPITYFNWNFRIQYWPDERGTAARQLSALLASENESVLDPDSFARQSVGVQGFPALERLLYAETALDDYQSNAFLCRLTQTISDNILEISAGVSQRWIDEYRAVVLEPASGGVYEDSQDLSIEFLKALQEALAKIRDLKLSPVVGNSIEELRERSAESWRSMRSLRNIRTNLAYLEPLFTAYSAVFQSEDVRAVTAAFDEVQMTLTDMPDSVVGAADNAELYASLQTVFQQMDALHEALEAAIKNTDLYLGFNSLDGD